MLLVYIIKLNKYNENKNKKLEIDLTMARRPKGNYEANSNWVSSVIVLQGEIKKKKITADDGYNYNFIQLQCRTEGYNMKRKAA